MDDSHQKAQYGNIELLRKKALQHKANGAPGELLINTPIGLSGVILIFVLFLLLGIGLITAGTYTSKIRVVGSLVPVKGVATLNSLSDGTVTELYVEAGAVVKAGQPIGRIKKTQALPDGTDLTKKLVTIINKQKSLLEQSSSNLGELKDTLDIAAADETKVSAKKLNLNAGLSKAVDDLISSKKTIASIYDELSKFGAHPEVESKRFRLEIKSDELNLERLKSDLLSIKAEGLALRRLYIQVFSEVQRSKDSINSALFDLEQKLVSLSVDSDSLIVAELQSQILDVNISLGQSVTSGTPLLTYTAFGGGLMAEVRIPDSSVFEVDIGAPVLIRYRAFPFEKYGGFKGEVSKISGTPNTLPGENEPHYIAQVLIYDQTVTVNSKSFQLKPGQALNAIIEIERKTVGDWIISMTKRGFDI